MKLLAASRGYSNIECILIIILFSLAIVIGGDSNGVECQWRGKSGSNGSGGGVYGSVVNRLKRKSGNYVNEGLKNSILMTKRLISGVKSDDKEGLATITADFEKVSKHFPTKPEPSPNIVHRYQYLDIDLVVNNIFSFASDVVHPPQLNDLKTTIKTDQTNDERTLMGKFTDCIQTGIASAEAYASLVRRYQRWYSLHRKLEELDRDVGAYLGIFGAEFSRSMAEVREEFSVPQDGYPKFTISKSSSSSGSDSDSDSRAGKLKEEPPAARRSAIDFVYEALKRTIPRLEAKLSEEDYNQKLGPARTYVESKHLDDNEVREKIKSFKSTITKKAKNWLISETRHMAKVALASAITTYVTSRYREMPSEDSMLYVGRLLGFLGAASVPYAVDTLRDQATRAALTLLDIVNPFPNLTQLLKKGFTAGG